MHLIFLGRQAQYETRVSDEDYEFLIGFRWSFAVSHPAGGLVYARRSVWVPNQNVNQTVLMHHVVLKRMKKERPSLRHTADHENGDSLCNERWNLRWATPEQQMRNRRGVRARPLERPMWDEEIPF